MKHRFAAFLGILALAACADAPTTRTAAGAGPSLAAAPATDVMAVVTPSGLVEVSWAHDGAEVTRWVLYRRPVGQVSWQTVKATYDVRVRRLSDSRYNVNVDGWQWMVCAFTGNTCTPSAVVTATGLRLTAPDYVQVVENSPEAVTLTWSRGDGPVLYTRIVRNGLGDPVLVRPPTTVYADSSVEAFRAYRYVLRSQNAVGISADSAVVTLVAGMPNAAPPQVTTDSARVIGQRLMVWGTVKSNVIPTRYSAEWKTVPEMTGIGRSKAGGVIEDTLLHHVAVALPVEAEGTYYARLSASNPMGSAQGQVRSAQLVRPSVPQDFDAFARADGTVEAGWTYDGPSVTSWRLLRRPLGTEAWTLARTGVGSTVRVLTDFAYDVNVDTWEWMVQACAGVLCTPSAVDQVSGLRLLPPEDLHTTSVAPGAVSLAWAPAGGPVVEQVVFRRASYGPVAQWQVPANAATFTDTTAQAGIQYHYFVWGRNRVGSSPPSAEVAVTP